VLGLLSQADTLALDAGADRWDFALEIDRLFHADLTINDLRWLVAKGFAEHGLWPANASSERLAPSKTRGAADSMNLG